MATKKFNSVEELKERRDELYELEEIVEMIANYKNFYMEGEEGTKKVIPGFEKRANICDRVIKLILEEA